MFKEKQSIFYLMQIGTQVLYELWQYTSAVWLTNIIKQSKQTNTVEDDEVLFDYNNNNYLISVMSVFKVQVKKKTKKENFILLIME